MRFSLIQNIKHWSVYIFCISYSVNNSTWIFPGTIKFIHSVPAFPFPWSFQMDLRCLRCLSFCANGCSMPGPGECYVKSTEPNRINILHEWNISAATVHRDKLLKSDPLQICIEYMKLSIFSRTKQSRQSCYSYFVLD